ncbi:MAG: tetratricopeptide repeat protein [Vicinamibacteria bacterium]|nr:tetratricopeptide repeat protein [Vicinamibacteria bacterium]
MSRLGLRGLLVLVLLAAPDVRAADGVDVRWPGGVESVPRTLDVTAAAPSLLVVRVWVEPYYAALNEVPIRWGNARNTIPPFPIGVGVSESRAWENGVPVEWLHVKDGSDVYLEYRFRITAGRHQATMFVIPPQERNLVGAFAGQREQRVRVLVESQPLENELPWGPAARPTPARSAGRPEPEPSVSGGLADRALEGCVEGGRFYSVGEAPRVVFLHDVVQPGRREPVDLRPYEGTAVRVRGALDPQDRIALDRGARPEVTARRCPAERLVAILEYDDVFRMLSRDETLARGLRQLELGFVRQAVATFDSILQRASDDGGALMGRGRAHAREGKWQAALADFERAAAAEPAAADAHAALCGALVQRGRLDAALVSCDRAIELDPGLAQAWAGRGVVMRRRGDPRAALSAYDASLRLNPDDEVVLTYRAGVLIEAGEHDAARRDLRRALSIDPHYSEARRRLQDLERQVTRAAVPGPTSGDADSPVRGVALELVRRLPHFTATPSRLGLEVARVAPLAQAKAPAWFVELRWTEAGEAEYGLALVASTAAPPPEGEWLAREGEWGVAAFEPGQDWADLLASLREGQFQAWTAVARGRLREVVRAQEQFAATAGGGRFAAELRCLVEPSSCGFAAVEPLLEPGFLRDEWSGFRYSLEADGRDREAPLAATFVVTAVAADVSNAVSSFCADESGRVCEVPTYVPFRLRTGACPLRCLPPE